MEEKINILIKELWVSPPILPTEIFIITIKGVIHNQDEKIVNIGTNFCIVINKNNGIKLNFLTMGGLHEWRGAILLLIINATGGNIVLKINFSL